MNFVRKNKLIILILLITLLKGVIWSYATPLFQAPDEQVHYASVQYYAEPAGYEPKSYDFPLEKTDMFNLRSQNLSPELMNFLNKTQFDKVRFHKEKAMDFRLSSIDGIYESDIRQNSLSRFVEHYPAWVIHYDAPYYQAIAGIENMIGSKSIIDRVSLERFFSVILLAVFVLFTYLMVRELGFSETVSALIAGAVSFQSMLTFITSSINIDALLIAGFGVLLYGAVRFLKNGAEGIAMACVIIGAIASYFTKPSGYFAFAVILLLIILFFLRQTKVRLQMSSLQKLVFYSIFSVITVTLGWAFFTLYESVKARYFPGNQSLSLLPDYIRHQLSYNVLYGHSTFYWGNFGWLDTPISQPLIWIIWIFLVTGFAGTIFYFGRNIYHWKSIKDKDKLFLYEVAFLALIVLGFSFMIHAVNFQQVNPNNVTDESGAIAIQGRYFFPVMGAKIFLIFWGLATLTRALYNKAKAELIALGLFIGMLLLNMISLLVYLIPRFYLQDDTAYFSQELLDRMSQYKPVLLKEWVIVFVLVVYLALLAKFVLKTGRKVF